MGLFRKKINPNKNYDMSEVLNLLSQPEYENYTSIEVGRGIYHIITIQESRKLEHKERERQSTRKQFYENINGKGAYQNQTAEIVNFNTYRNKEKNQAKIINFNSEEEIGIG